MMPFAQKMLFSAMALAFAGVAQAAGGTLVYCSEASPAGFDTPQYTSGTENDASANNTHDTLLQFPRGGTQAGPGLAVSYTVSPDGLEYIFKLRKGVKWHSTKWFKPTRDFNADDVVWTFDRLQNKDNPFNKAYPAEFPYFVDMGFDKNIKKVEKIDDYTVRFVLDKNDASFTQTIAMPFASIQSKEYMQNLLKKGTPEKINSEPVGTGPFVFQRYQKDAQIRYKANKQYWNKADMPLVDNLIFSINKDASVRYQKVKKGECHIMSYPLSADIESMKKDRNIKVLSQAGFNVGFIYYNNEKAPFNNPDVRNALNLAMNKDAIIKAVYGGQGQLAPNPMPPTQWSFNKNIKPSVQDLDKAKALLAKAGFAGGFETTLWALPVQRPYNPNGRLMAELVQADWAKVGVKAKIVTYEWGEYLKRGKAGEHDAIMVGWTGDNGDPDNWLGTLFSCESVGGSNYSRFCYEPFQKLITEARQLNDVNERTKLYEQAQVIFAEQTPGSPIGTSVVNVPTRANVKGFKISPFGAFQFTGVSVK